MSEGRRGGRPTKTVLLEHGGFALVGDDWGEVRVADGLDMWSGWRRGEFKYAVQGPSRGPIRFAVLRFDPAASVDDGPEVLDNNIVTVTPKPYRLLGREVWAAFVSAGTVREDAFWVVEG